MCLKCVIDYETKLRIVGIYQDYEAYKLISNENKPIYFSELFSDFHIIPLETKEECLINQIDNIKLINDTICILDRYPTKSIFLFSASAF